MNSKIYQKRKELQIGDGKLNINIYNGDVTYNYPLMTIGGGNYQIITSIIYNNNYSNEKFNRKLGFDNGWKLNFEEYLFVSDEGYDKYIYIDGAWNIHYFIKYTSDYTYYDESGTGLKLTTNTSYNQIYDENNNIYTFDKITGKLISITSGVNKEIIKEISYDEEGRLVSISDSRKKDNKVNFIYNDSNCLVKVSSRVKDVYYTLEYDNKKLVKIYQETNQTYLEVHEFYYESDAMKTIIKSKTNEALLLSYNQNKLTNVKKKVVSTIIDTLNSSSYVGEEQILGNDNYLTNNLLKEKERKNIIGEDIINEIAFTYNEAYTDITNNKNITYRYFFDIEGRMLSILEKGKENDKYFTLSKPTGWSVEINEQSNYYINNKPSKMLNKIDKEYVLTIDNNNLTSFNTSLDNTSQYYNISFWISFNNEQDSSSVAQLSYKLGEDEIKRSVVISKTLTGTWQQVQIPLLIEKLDTIITDMKIMVITDNFASSEDKILINDVRINKGNTKLIYIDSVTYGSKKNEELKLGSKIVYKKGLNQKEVTLSKDFYLTEQDIIATYKSKYYSMCEIGNLSATYFDLYYNNKTKVIQVNLVKLIPEEETTDDYRFIFGKYNENDERIETDTPNYHLRTMTLIPFEDNKKAYLITETHQKITKTSNNRYVFDIYTLIGVEENKNTQLNQNKLLTSVISQNEDGTINYTKYIKRIYGNNELKEENIELTTNEYDEYGNLIKTKTSTNKSTEELVKEYYYDGETPKERENVIKIKENGNITYIFYNSDSVIYRVKHSIDLEYIDGQIINKEEEFVNYIDYYYDEYGDLINMKFYGNNGEQIYENQISYDERRNINRIKDDNIKLGIIYNSLNEPCEIYQNKKLLQKYVTKKQDDKEIYTTMYYHGPFYNKQIDTLDNDGNVTLTEMIKYQNKVPFDKQKVIYVYENLENESPSLRRIKGIIDDISEDRYDYTYIDTPADGTVVKYENSSEFIVTTYPNQTKIYQIPTDQKALKYKVEQEDEMNSNPKLTYNYSKNDDGEELIKYYSYDYEYDGLNRLINQAQQTDTYKNATIYNSRETNYYENTNFPYEIKYKVKSVIQDSEKVATLTYQNSYKQGNIVKVVEEGTRFINNPKNEESLETKEIKRKETKYEYDSFNRLIKEEKPNKDVYRYIYGPSQMIEEIRKNEETIETRKYDACKLTKIIKNDKIINIEYDDYGNIIQFGNNQLTYNYLNLISKYQKDNNEVYNYEYNYQGNRTKKIKENDYEVRYYSENNIIVGEDVKDLKTNAIIRQFRYYYDAFGICGINYVIDGENHYYNLVKDSIGNITKVMYRGKMIGEYTYDAWGNSEAIELASANQIDKDIIKYNPFRYKGYYLDVETGLFYCNSRYYSPELCRWISLDDVDYLDPESVNGLNLYCYCYNNPICRAKSSNVTNLGMSSYLSMNTIRPTFKLPVVNFKAESSNYWNPHWKNKWLDTDRPRLFVVSNSAVELINWGLTVYKGSLYFDNYQQHSIYNASLNLNVYAGFNFEKNKYGVELGGSVGRLGYAGRFIDVQVDFLTAKFFFIYEDGKLKIDPGFGWVDFGISINIAAIIEYLKGNS